MGGGGVLLPALAMCKPPGAGASQTLVSWPRAPKPAKEQKHLELQLRTQTEGPTLQAQYMPGVT